MSVTNSGTMVASDIQLDTDGDGIEDDWEWIHFGSLTAADALTDSDQDGSIDRDEFLAGTWPKDALSQLKVTAFPDAKVIRWASSKNRSYTINATTSLVSTAFTPVVTNLAATPPENPYTNLPISVESAQFYRIELE